MCLTTDASLGSMAATLFWHHSIANGRIFASLAHLQQQLLQVVGVLQHTCLGTWKPSQRVHQHLTTRSLSKLAAYWAHVHMLVHSLQAAAAGDVDRAERLCTVFTHFCDFNMGLLGSASQTVHHKAPPMQLLLAQTFEWAEHSPTCCRGKLEHKPQQTSVSLVVA